VFATAGSPSRPSVTGALRDDRQATHPTIYPNRPTVLGMDTFLQNWTVTIFLPAILIGLAILVVVVKVKDRD
jgi:hypothetical protein